MDVRRVAIVLAIVFAAAVGLASAARADLTARLMSTPPLAVTVSTKPSVIKAPSPAQLKALEPSAVRRQGMAGMVALTCIATRSGSLEDCTVESAAPTGFGLDQAALKAASLYVVEPATEDGKPVASHYWLRVSFPGTKPVVYRKADVLYQPSGDEVDRLFPSLAQRKHVSGKVVPICRVALAGKFEDCETVSEVPTGYGFDPAARAMAALYEVSPPTFNGDAVAGERVLVPFTFNTENPTAKPAVPVARAAKPDFSIEPAKDLNPSPPRYTDPLVRSNDLLWLPALFAGALTLGMGAVLWWPRRRPKPKPAGPWT